MTTAKFNYYLIVFLSIIYLRINLVSKNFSPVFIVMFEIQVRFYGKTPRMIFQ